MDENKLFKTRDFYLACFLKAKGLMLEKTVMDSGIATFCFKDVEVAEDLVPIFYGGLEEVSVNRFVNAIRDLKALIHNI